MMGQQVGAQDELSTPSTSMRMYRPTICCAASTGSST